MFNNRDFRPFRPDAGQRSPIHEQFRVARHLLSMRIQTPLNISLSCFVLNTSLSCFVRSITTATQSGGHMSCSITEISVHFGPMQANAHQFTSSSGWRDTCCRCESRRPSILLCLVLLICLALFLLLDRRYGDGVYIVQASQHRPFGLFPSSLFNPL